MNTHVILSSIAGSVEDDIDETETMVEIIQKIQQEHDRGVGRKNFYNLRSVVNTTNQPQSYDTPTPTSLGKQG